MASSRRHCNELGGKRWLQNSISVWSDIRKTAEEARLKHPAMFPGMLVERLIETFLPPEGTTVLDPFAGSGGTVVTAAAMGKCGVGLELSAEYVALAEERLRAIEPENSKRRSQTRSAKLISHYESDLRPLTSGIIHASASDLREHVAADSVDLCITSPPYWNILTRKRTADYKSVRNYGENDGDLGTIADYREFLDALADVFQQVFVALKPGAYCCVIVMDLRKKNRFFPFHSDQAARLQELGFVYDDLIIWNRQSEYNNLRPLGYPSVFRVNKVHEFILLMQKPRVPVGVE
jgi:DNA modification methylase